MSRLSGRQIYLQIDTIKINGLRIHFKAEKSLAKDPNKCEVKVWNLTPDQRAQLTKKRTPTVALSAGYAGETTSIFLGEVISVLHEKDKRSSDVITTVNTTDGGDKMQKARVNMSFGPRTKIDAVLRALVKSLGLKEGNVSRVAAELAKGTKQDIYLGGVTLSGNASQELTQLIRSAGLEWSVQDGAVQILNPGKAINSSAVLLDESVLLDTPTVNTKGIVTGRTFIQRDFLPGRQVRIQHEFVKGAFRLEKCTYTGDTGVGEDEWYVEFEAKGKLNG